LPPPPLPSSRAAESCTYKQAEVQNKPIFFLPDQMITGTGTVVNVHTKLKFSSFSIFLNGINLIIYKFQSIKFNFSPVWGLRSEIRNPEKIILDQDPGSLGKKPADHQIANKTYFLLKHQ
jgi:hypothetical protein